MKNLDLPKLPYDNWYWDIAPDILSLRIGEQPDKLAVSIMREVTEISWVTTQRVSGKESRDFKPSQVVPGHVGVDGTALEESIPGVFGRTTYRNTRHTQRTLVTVRQVAPSDSHVRAAAFDALEKLEALEAQRDEHKATQQKLSEYFGEYR